MRKIKPAWSYVSVFTLIGVTAATVAAYYVAEGQQTKEMAVIESKAADVDRRVTKLEEQLLAQLQENNKMAIATVREVQALRSDITYYQKYGKVR